MPSNVTIEVIDANKAKLATYRDVVVVPALGDSLIIGKHRFFVTSRTFEYSMSGACDISLGVDLWIEV